MPTIIQNDSMGKALEEHAFWNVVKLIGGIGIEVATSWIVSADSAHNRLLVAGVNVFLLVGFEVVGDIITYCLMSGEIWQSNASYHIGQTLFSVFFLLGTTIFAVYWNRMEKQMRRKIILLSVLFCGCQCFFMYSLWHLNRTAMEAFIQYYIVLGGVVTVIADYLIFDILTSTMEAQRREMELEQLRQQQETQYQYYQLVQENVRVIFITEHAARVGQETFERYKTDPSVILIPIPGSGGTDGLGMERVHANVEKAIGANILIDEEQ